MSLPNPIFAAQYPRPLIFQTMNSVRPNNLSLKYQRFTPSGWIEMNNDTKIIIKFKFFKKTRFFCNCKAHQLKKKKKTRCPTEQERSV